MQVNEIVVNDTTNGCGPYYENEGEMRAQKPG